MEVLRKIENLYGVIGLGYGDEGKGTIVDSLAKKLNAETIVRFNGGSQAAHHVLHNNFIHCFSQFGSGTFSNSKTYLSKFMYFDPISFMVEGEKLKEKGIKNPYEKVFVDEDCVIITPFQKVVGRMRELSIQKGSCGMGVGETARDSEILGKNILKAKDLLDHKNLEEKLLFLWSTKLDQAEQLFEENKSEMMKENLEKIKSRKIIENICKEYLECASKINIIQDYKLEGKVIFEGAQGVLLDKEKGFIPYITSTKTTFENAKEIVKETPYTKIGVVRGYMTRHGKGPFVSEDNSLSELLEGENNVNNFWQGNFRIGWADLVALKYSLEVVNGVDSLAITNLDKLEKMGPIKICTGYRTSEKNSEFFEYEDRIIAQIKNIELNEEESRRRTKILMNCEPIYNKFTNLDNYLAFLEGKDGLATPIKMLSYGKSHEDKIYKF